MGLGDLERRETQRNVKLFNRYIAAKAPVPIIDNLPL